MTPPKWLRRACLIALLGGLLLVVLGPVLARGVVSLTLDKQAADAGEALTQAMAPWVAVLLWTTPLGMALVFMGTIGLLLLWVTHAAEPPSEDGLRK